MTDTGHDPRAAPGSEPPLRAFMDGGPAIAFVKDDQGRYLYVNPTMERLFGVAMADILGKADIGWLPPSIAESVREQDPRVLATGEAVETIETVPLPDGTTQHWMLVSSRFPDPTAPASVGGLALNVTDLERARMQLADSEHRYRHLVESSQGLICTHDMEGRLLSVNPAALRLTGLSANGVIGHNLGDLVTDVTRAEFPRYLERIDHQGEDAGLMFVRARDGRELVWQFRNVKVTEPGQPPYVLGHAQDVTALREAQEQLRQLAMTDELTGLHNRRGLFVNGSRILGEAVRQHKGAAAVYADIDGLKGINDRYGHDAGSALIVSAADILKNSFRAADIVARVGGDEFVALAIVPPADVTTITTRLRWHLDRFNASSDLPYRLAMSIGLATFEPHSSQTLDDLVKAADEAMYQRKHPQSPPS
jgi:diguanylate cyclase (GGDEF)-like protein/PAS domain S-box-containing protein